MSDNTWINFDEIPPIFYTTPIVLLALIPMLFMSITSFVKFSVIFAILRNALGGNQIPSAALCGLLAIILSIYTFSPVASEISQNIVMANNAAPSKTTTKTTPKSPPIREIISSFAHYWDAVRLPLENFLAQHAHWRERAFFATRVNLAQKRDSDAKCDATYAEPAARGCRFPNENLISLIPAFLLSELKEAFSFGFAIFIPFLVIDLVVSNILAALGMMMVSPTTISFPLKLLLFVLSDGWYLLTKNLILSYLSGGE